jgi:hypothetical protein
MPKHEMYLLGGQKRLRHGRDMVALDYEAKSIVLGWFGGKAFWAQPCGDRYGQRQTKVVEDRELGRKRVSVW